MLWQYFRGFWVVLVCVCLFSRSLIFLCFCRALRSLLFFRFISHLIFLMYFKNIEPHYVIGHCGSAISCETLHPRQVMISIQLGFTLHLSWVCIN